MVVYLVMTETRGSNTNELLSAECRAVFDSEEKAKSYILYHLAKYDDNSGRKAFYYVYACENQDISYFPVMRIEV